MKLLPTLPFIFAGLAAARLGAQDLIDWVDESLTFSLHRDEIRARVSGLLDIEGYHFQRLPPGLIDASGQDLFNPRLTMFLDAQLGPYVYLFAQGRVDRGFDPSDANVDARADEYALRISPWKDGRASVQVGKFATVVGNWVARHQSWQNPFITAPLPYENLTRISDVEAPGSAQEFLGGYRSRYEYNPVIWGPSYASGASIAGVLGKLDYAVEVKNASLSSRPESWDATDVGFEHPTASGHVSFRPNQAWNFGISCSEGPYLHPNAASTLPAGRDLGDYRELVVGQDVAFAWHRLQLWAEAYESRFKIPQVGDADTFAYYLEAKLKLLPQLYGALRWNQQIFGTVPDGYGGRTAWGNDVWRTDAALGYRFTAHTQLKLQYSLQHRSSSARDFSNLIAAQFTVWF